MEMPKPQPAHLKLSIMEGLWLGDEKMHPSPWDPKGGTAQAQARNQVRLGGFNVLHEYEQRRDGKTTFQGLGVIGWDSHNNEYTLHWFDSMGMAPNLYSGPEENYVFTMTSRHPQGYSRAVFDFSKAGTYQFKMEFSGDGKLWHPFVEGNYRKQ